MRVKIQNNIDQIKKLAKSPVKRVNTETVPGNFRIHDSLSKSIRNAQEASTFLAELNASIAISRKK